MKRLVLFACGLWLLACGVFAAASDVAYVYRNSKMIDDDIVSVFGEMGLSVDFVDSGDIKSVDFSGYDFVFIGDERLRNLKYLPTDKIVSVNRYYGEELGFIERGGIFSLAANMPLVIVKNPVVQVYTRAMYKIGSSGVPYYYIPDKYQKSGAVSVARTPIGYKRKEGDVISYLPGKCFFGVAKAEYWTDDARELFRDCVGFVLGSSGGDGEDGDGDGVHDVEIDADYIHSVGGVRIKDDESEEYLIDNVSVLFCNKKYRIDFKTMNVGDFVENVSISGSFGDFNWTSEKEGFEPGKSSTAGSRTVNVTFEPGVYDIEVLSFIEDDATPENNFGMRSVEVVC